MATHSSIPGLPSWLSCRESACNVGDLGSIPGLGRSPGEGKGYLLQYSSLENSTDCKVHGVTKSLTQLSNLHFHFLSLLYSRTLLFIHPLYNSLQLLIPKSQSFPPPLSSSLATTSLFSMSVSLFLIHRYVHWCHILYSTCK